MNDQGSRTQASYERKVAEREGFEPPCRLLGKTLSRRPRYDHFGTSPLLVGPRSSLRPLCVPHLTARSGRRSAAVPSGLRTSLASPELPRCALGVPLRGTSFQPSLALTLRASHLALSSQHLSARRLAKKLCITARQSSSRTPPSASIRWFSAGCSCARIADSSAPAFGSRVP